MSQLLTDAVCGETVEQLDAEIKQCDTLGWHAGIGWEWVAELRLYRAAIDDQRAAVARRDAALAACDIDDPAVMAWLEACAEVWGATELAQEALDAACERAHDLAHKAARAHYWRDELESIYADGPLGPSATPGAWLRWIVESGADGYESTEDPGVAVWVSEGRDAASLVVWATPRTWTEYTADPVSLVLATLRCSPGQGADTA